MTNLYLGVDPGRSKTGLAVVDSTGKIIFLKVAETLHIADELQLVKDKYQLQQIIIGNGTNSKKISSVVEDVFSGITVNVIGEAHSTEEARNLYWQVNPPKGWHKLIPLGLLVPAEPLDAYAAVVLVKRFLAK